MSSTRKIRKLATSTPHSKYCPCKCLILHTCSPLLTIICRSQALEAQKQHLMGVEDPFIKEAIIYAEQRVEQSIFNALKHTGE